MRGDLLSHSLLCPRLLLSPSSFCPLRTGARWERAAGEVRPDLERDGTPPARAPRERREPGAGPEDREAALGCQGAAEPDVPHRAGLAGDQRGEGQSQGHRLKPAPVLPSGCRRW